MSENVPNPPADDDMPTAAEPRPVASTGLEAPAPAQTPDVEAPAETEADLEAPAETPDAPEAPDNDDAGA